jgi:4-hydroxy-2-oxovalerate aldolase
MLLDTTLRDGSCAIDFQFDEADITSVVAGLCAAGIRFIEVGHGVSAGLDHPPHRRPRVSDERTFELARSVARDARVGAVFVPALTSLRAMEDAIAHLDFVRLAPAPSLLDTCHEFVRAARRRDKLVFLQLVKTHVYPIDQIVGLVRPLVEEGVHALYVVDTAGCMVPSEVGHYVSRLYDSFGAMVGFHGHDNLSLAVANSLAALDAGATFVDGTLGGLGRGAGNMQLEAFVGALQTRGLSASIALHPLFESSLFLWQRFPGVARGTDPIEVYYALRRWDSLSRMEMLAAAEAIGVSPFVFIDALTKRASGPFISEDDVQRTLLELAGRQPARGAPSRRH